jgi:hypothetical protein
VIPDACTSWISLVENSINPLMITGAYTKMGWGLSQVKSASAGFKEKRA